MAGMPYPVGMCCDGFSGRLAVRWEDAQPAQDGHYRFLDAITGRRFAFSIGGK
jgi:hypothetical protein